MRNVAEPPESRLDSKGNVDAGWWHSESAERIVCDLCPRKCSLKDGDRGFCFVRKNVDGGMKLTTWGKSTGFCIDPIEKKPLNHFLPGTPVLSFGTAGCNLGCSFCQNWDISRSREVERLSEVARPEAIAQAALQTGCASVAYTYNDPIIWAEYAIDTARKCREVGIKSVAVTAGYIEPAARPAFFHEMDAANVDLKAFTEDFYHKITYSHLAPVLETLHWLKHESDVWFEITNLLIPDTNDSPDELGRMCDWILESVGDSVPVHFTAFHPDFRMKDRDRTPHETLLSARSIAVERGIRFAYVGNVHDVQNQSTWCPSCGELLIERDWHQLGTYNLEGNQCRFCSQKIEGRFRHQPGDWGRRRQPIQISRFGETVMETCDTPNLVPLSTPPLAQNQQAAPMDSQPESHERSPSESGSMANSVSTSPQLSDSQEHAIHQAAAEVITQQAMGQPIRLTDPSLGGAAETFVMGAFTTVKRNGQLRGCCGSLGKPMKLVDALTQAAKRTATEDRRFPPVSPGELSHLSLDVTLLYNFEAVDCDPSSRSEAIELGKHGVRISRAKKSALFLPVVAEEQGWDAETFLGQLCRKAGLPTSDWRNGSSELTKFEGHSIRNSEGLDFPYSTASESLPGFSQADVEVLAQFACNNILAQIQGAVPGCFPPQVSDGSVDGLALRVAFRESVASATFSQLQIRAQFPLQTTLLNLTQAAAAWVSSNPDLARQTHNLQADLALFGDTAVHGQLSQPALEGVDCARRAVIVKEGQKVAWRYSREEAVESVLEQVARDARVKDPEVAQILSMAVLSSAPSIENSNAPQPIKGPERREPAVAGRFYPSGEGALNGIIRKCFGEACETKRAWPGIMVPHAGLQFSGAIAAGVLKQLVIPRSVLIIGPKHTRDGVDWAVSPCHRWNLPIGDFNSDADLAARLVGAIDGLEFDAGAHANEHCIEVILPLLHHVAPDSRIVGIALGGGSLRQCLQFGQQLALEISKLDERPLLVVSSDMNHFASDEDNRVLDEIAIKAMETGDPETLFTTVRENNISMCGVLPAIVVMEALKTLDQLDEVRRAGYATSAEVSGDLTRVVGYAGMLLGESE